MEEIEYDSASAEKEYAKSLSEGMKRREKFEVVAFYATITGIVISFFFI